MKSSSIGLRIGLVLLLAPMSRVHAEEPAAPTDPEGRSHDTMLVISPLYGWNRNETIARGGPAAGSSRKETAPEYGLFTMLGWKNLVLTDFVFFTDVNDTDVFGNLFFANWYGSHRRRLSWNLGAGHLYHKIEPPNHDITVTVPMLKAGPLINIPELHLSINPYVGYAWEEMEMPQGDVDNHSWMYGVTVGWRWRMLAATVKYYFQDGREGQEYHTVRARAHCMFTRSVGAVARFDYMEHVTSDDTSLLLGPVFIF